MEKVFHGPGGPVRYKILFEDPDSRVVVADDETLGKLVATPSTDPRWCILDLGVSSPLFCSVMREDGSSVVVYGCSKCGALESRRRWPPEDPDQ